MNKIAVVKELVAVAGLLAGRTVKSYVKIEIGQTYRIDMPERGETLMFTVLGDMGDFWKIKDTLNFKVSKIPKKMLESLSHAGKVVVASAKQADNALATKIDAASEHLTDFRDDVESLTTKIGSYSEINFVIKTLALDKARKEVQDAIAKDKGGIVGEQLSAVNREMMEILKMTVDANTEIESINRDLAIKVDSMFSDKLIKLVAKLDEISKIAAGTEKAE